MCRNRVATGVRILHYLDVEGMLERSGIATSTDHQRTALSRYDDIEILTSPWRGTHSDSSGIDSPSTWRSVLTHRKVPPVDYDIAHCNGIGPGSLAIAKHARATGRPLVLHAHTTREDFVGSFRGSRQIAPILGRYLRWFYSQADLLLCPSEYTKGVLEAARVDAPVESITNGVDHESLTYSEPFRRVARARFDRNGILVSTLGNVFERKGVSTFCRVAERTPYTFCWFGRYDRWPIRSKTVSQSINHPPSNVTFTGWIEDKRFAFASSDVVFFPAHVENQGIAVLEAMACGKAVVLRNIPVFAEQFTDGFDCLFCDSEDEFVDALDRLATDETLRHRLGNNAIRTASAHRIDHLGTRLRASYENAYQRESG